MYGRVFAGGGKHNEMHLPVYNDYAYFICASPPLSNTAVVVMHAHTHVHAHTHTHADIHTLSAMINGLDGVAACYRAHSSLTPCF